ncbi:MAG: division/cell wall cluster transcriptional repressor MraZ [Planctomycetota bacterium]|jgi:MraZ protein
MLDFDGEYTHKIDKKGRVFMPTALLDEVKEASERGHFHVMANKAVGCFDVFTESEFKKWRRSALSTEKTALGARLLRRYIGASTRKVKVDSQNRILLPEELRSRIKLEGEVLIIGLGNSIEIWDAKIYAETAFPEADEYFGAEAAALRNADYVPEEGEL